MSWALWWDSEDRLHSAPIDEENDCMLPPHIPSEQCPCQPAVTEDGRVLHREVM